MGAGISHSKQLSQICGYATAASWQVNVWDWFIRLDDEVTFIWPMARTAYIKWLYLFGKYFGLTVQAGVFAIQVVYIENYSMSLRGCRIYRAVEMAAVALLMLCFDIVLLFRIYALYGRRKWSCTFATCAALIEFLTTITTIVSTIPTMAYDSACAMVHIPKLLVVFVGGTFTSQAILLWLAYRKRERVVRPRASISWVTIRDGLWLFLCIAAFLVIVFVLILGNSPATTVMIFFLPMFISVGTSHLVLNLQRVPYVQPTQQLEFTTEILAPDVGADSSVLSSTIFQSSTLQDSVGLGTSRFTPQSGEECLGLYGGASNERGEQYT